MPWGLLYKQGITQEEVTSRLSLVCKYTDHRSRSACTAVHTGCADGVVLFIPQLGAAKACSLYHWKEKHRIPYYTWALCSFIFAKWKQKLECSIEQHLKVSCFCVFVFVFSWGCIWGILTSTFQIFIFFLDLWVLFLYFRDLPCGDMPGPQGSTGLRYEASRHVWKLPVSHSELAV